MPKTKEELDALKQEYKSLTTKLEELTEDELKQVCAGVNIWDIAVKLKEKFNILSGTNNSGESDKPKLTFWDEGLVGFINNPKDPQK